MKRTTILTVFASLALTIAAGAQIKVTHGPYLCDVTQDGVTVVWTTDKPALSWVEVAPGDDRSFYAEEHPRFYETLAGRRLTHKTLHRVRITGLEPGTRYSYRVFSKEVIERGGRHEVQLGKHVAAGNVYSRKPLSFTTLGTDGDNFSFLVLNDMHENPAKIGSLLDGVDTDNLSFFAFNGDMVSSAREAGQVFTALMDTCTVLFASELPVLMVRGNHETRGPFADMFMDYFPSGDGRYYSHRKIGSTSIVILDSGEDKPDSDIEYGGLAQFDDYMRQQADWLAGVVASEEFRSSSRKIVLMHIPPNNSSWYGTGRVRDLFVPLLNGTGVDVMLSGHTHRHAFLPADGQRDFPVLINDNNSLLRCDVEGGKIRFTITGPEGKVQQVHEL